jgi:hypothetical protein
MILIRKDKVMKQELINLRQNVMRILTAFQAQEMSNRLSEFSMLSLVSLVDGEFKKVIDSIKEE